MKNKPRVSQEIREKEKGAAGLTILGCAVIAIVATVIIGCMTSASARTETKNPDGTVTVSVVKVFGTGDKASQIATEGLFADGAPGDLGAGVGKAQATQDSTGTTDSIKSVLELFRVLTEYAAAMREAIAPAAAVVP